MTSKAEEAADSQFGRYVLRERLGTGGMAEVWLARDARGREVVVKRILPHLVADADFVKMFLREAQISMRLRHPNIVEVHESGSVGGHYFLAMQYLRGRDLRTVQRMLPSGAPPAMAAFIVHEVLRALDYTHNLSEAGKPLRLVHRDVSPANVMLGFDGKVTLLDFGVAKAAADAIDLTQTGTLRGKIPYMAPEQMSGKKFDHRVDVFACGVVLHELLTGRRLFKGESDMDSIELVRSAPVPLPSQVNRHVPQALDGICMKALARNVKDRYPSANVMALDLNAFLVADKFGAPALAAFMRQSFRDQEPPSGIRRLSSGDFSTATMKVKATTLLSRRAMIVDRIGESTYDQFIAEVSDEIPFCKATLLPSTQIPVADFLRFNDALVDRFFAGDKRIYWTFGEQSGEWLSKNGPYVAQFQRGDFKRFWSILPAFWKTFYSEGEARVSGADLGGGQKLDIVIDSPVEHVYFEYSVLGFVKRGLEVLGARVRVERVKGFSSGDREIHYRFTLSA